MGSVLHNVACWIVTHGKLIIKVVSYIIILLVGFFTHKLPGIFAQVGKNNKNAQTNAGGEVHQHDLIQSNASNSNQSLVYGDHTTINQLADRETIEDLMHGYINRTYPACAQACNAMRTNTLEFMSKFEKELREYKPKEIQKFAEPIVQVAVQNLIKAAALTDNSDIHGFLLRLIEDRVRKPTAKIADLAVSKAIEASADLDVDLIRVLSLSFVFSRTKFTKLGSIEALVARLLPIVELFNEIQVSQSSFEFLESILCGKYMHLYSLKLVEIISDHYPYLFVGQIPAKEMTKLKLPGDIKAICFEDDGAGYFKLRLPIGQYLFEDVEVRKITDHTVLSFDKEIKKKLVALYQQYKLPVKTITSILCEKIPNFEELIIVWNNNGFNNFTLTAVGIAIGRAYLEQMNIGSYDLNIWIK